MVAMKQVKGFYIPASEKHLVPFLESGPEFATGPTYQLSKLIACLPYVKTFRHAVDVGAHCGLWSRVLERMFTTLTAFEPMPDHIECFLKNIPMTGVILETVALGAAPGKVKIRSSPSSTGDSHIDPEHGLEVGCTTLDSYRMAVLDFLKIDCEGYESFVLEGGEQTIRRLKPVIIVEQKPGKGAQFGRDDVAACHMLKAWGAQQRFNMAGDYCFTW